MMSKCSVLPLIRMHLATKDTFVADDSATGRKHKYRLQSSPSAWTIGHVLSERLWILAQFYARSCSCSCARRSEACEASSLRVTRGCNAWQSVLFVCGGSHVHGLL